MTRSDEFNIKPRGSSKLIRVLVVDDSAIVRRILSRIISQHEDLQVVGTASNPFIARDKILELKPDVITLDLEMPRMDGLTFLRRIMKYHPLPVIVVSSNGQESAVQAMDALRLGAIEVLAKPNGASSLSDLITSLPDRIRSAAKSKRVVPEGETLRETRLGFAGHDFLIAIGASTGGTEAIERIVTQMPENCPPIVIVQHIPPVFSSAFASRLNKLSKIEVKEAEDGDAILSGRALVAPGDFQMVVRNSTNGLRVALSHGPFVCYQRPSIDVLFQSIAECVGRKCVAALLTGMGSDGAQGLLQLRQSGARTVTQDEASCVVYGMPREAVNLGASERILPLGRIATALLQLPS